MLSDKRYGLSVNIMATRVMPSLLPQTVNPSLNLEQFTILIEVSTPLYYTRLLRSVQTFILHGLLSVIAPQIIRMPSNKHLIPYLCRPSAGAARDAGPHRPATAQQTEAGQPLNSLATASTVAPPVLLGQHARAPLQHP